MRRGGLMLPIVALLIWIAVVMYPALASIGAIFNQSRSDVAVRSPGQLLLTSTLWALAVALGAMLIGWLPGRVLGKSLNMRAGGREGRLPRRLFRGRGSGFVPLATLMLVPICLPAYVVFYAWWQS